MVVLVIAGVIFSFAAPGYARYVEKTRAKRAISNLDAIYNMQKLYKLDNGVFYECMTAPCSSLKDAKGNPYYSCPATAGCTLKLINDALSIVIVDPYFDYKIEVDGASGGYKATATRKIGGFCGGEVIYLKSNSRTITKGCANIW